MFLTRLSHEKASKITNETVGQSGILTDRSNAETSSNRKNRLSRDSLHLKSVNSTGASIKHQMSPDLIKHGSTSNYSGKKIISDNKKAQSKDFGTYLMEEIKQSLRSGSVEKGANQSNSKPMLASGPLQGILSSSQAFVVNSGKSG